MKKLKLLNNYFYIRQFLLKKLVPEILWKKYINLDGVPIPIRGMPFSFGVKLSISWGDYELPERILCSMVLEKGMKVIEMGTSVGILAGIIASKIGSTGKLITIEASPKKIRIASSWLLNHYPNIKIIRGYAFPCAEVPRDIFVKEFHEATATLGGEVEYGFKKNKNMKKDFIPLLDINKIKNEYLFDNADLLVADVEGAEELLLLSEVSFPKKLKNLVIETHPAKYKKTDDLQNIILKICNSGFTLIHQIENSYLFSRLENKIQ